MELVCYCSRDGKVPIKEYLAKYVPMELDSLLVINKKLKKYSKIESILRLVLENRGIIGGEYSSSLKGKYDFQEIKIKEGQSLSRILYFCYYKEELVLLSGFDKPCLYEKAKKKKVDQMIKKEFDQAQEYYVDFINNPFLYEDYE